MANRSDYVGNMATTEHGYHLVQGLVRGLAVLEALNLHAHSAASVTEISQSTRLHRTTVKRLLESLRHLGYVSYGSASDSYALTYNIRRLSENVRDDLWISQIASPILRRLTEKILWPSDLMTLDEDELVVRDSTHPLTPFSFTRGVFGRRLSMLRTSAGRAYLAFCPNKEREVLLQLLRKRSASTDEPMDERDIDRVLRQVRERGFAVNEGGPGAGGDRFGAVAVPIRVGDRVIACLNIVFLKRAVSFKEVIERHLPALRAATNEIERKVARRQLGTRTPKQSLNPRLPIGAHSAQK